MNAKRIAKTTAGYLGRLPLCAAAILLVQLLRSALFLAAAMPILIAGSGPRRPLVLTLGLAFYVLVGLFSMIQTYRLAPTLLVLHNLEIFADSMVYALAVVLLLASGDTAKADEQFARGLPCSAPATVEK